MNVIQKKMSLTSTEEYFNEHIESFKNKNVLIIGDVMLDHYIFGHVDRISPEAPVPIVNIEREEYRLGGAGNVAANIKALGAKPFLIGVIGNDINGTYIFNIMEDLDISSSNLIIVKNKMPTTIKTRIISQNQQLIRLDKEVAFIDEENHKFLNHIIGKIIYNYQIDIIIISDYAKGVINGSMPEIIKTYNKGKCKIILDPKPQNMHHYKGLASYITPNINEAIKMTNTINTPTGVNIAISLMEQLQCKGVLITKGESGLSIYKRKDVYFDSIDTYMEAHHFPAVAKSVYDVTGAGDTVLSTFALAMTTELELKEMASIANIAAGNVVTKVGTSTITNDELKKSVKEYYDNIQ